MKRPKILITTNIPSYVEWLGQIFKEGYEIFWEVPQNLQHSFLRNQVDIIIFIPGSSNLNILEDLFKVYEDKPIFLIKQEAKPQEVAYAFRKGVDDFLINPDQNQILELVEKLIERGVKKPTNSIKAVLSSLTNLFKLSNRYAPGPSIALANSSLHFNSVPIGISHQATENWRYEEEDSTNIEVKLMGKLEIFIQGKKMSNLPGKKGQGLLSYLFYHHPRPIAREILMETFWPKVATASSRNSLNVALHGIRKSFEKFLPDSDILIYKNGAYSLNPEWEIKVDVKAFLDHWKKGQSMERSTGIISAISCYEKAASFYTNTLLMDDLYSEWIQPERDNLQETYLAILERLIDYRIDMEEYKLAHHYGEQALRLDTCREHIHRQMMLAHCKSGRRNQAIRQYQRCCEVLKEELNISPAPKTQEMFEKIRSNQLC